MDTFTVWILFGDKGIFSQKGVERGPLDAGRIVTERSLSRRRKVLGEEAPVGPEDLPLLEEYVAEVKRLGVKIRSQSRWLNAMSAEATAEQVESIGALPCVRRVDPVLRYRRVEPGIRPALPSEKMAIGRDEFGYAYDQAMQMLVPELYYRGLTGKGIRICFLDTGFDYRRHVAFRQMNIVAARDFVHGDGEVADEPGQDIGDGTSPQHAHGTQALSVVAGYDPGLFVGIAHEAEFILGKTEEVSSETPIEEDYWVAGIEWADSLGSDIVSSSLGYNTWDPGTGTDYTLEDMDGMTAKTTKVAQLAVAKGMVVVAAAGNEGKDEWQKVLTPADGKDVIAVGAVDRQGLLTEFSSVGPTADGRIKPDVVALGAGVWCVDLSDPSGYTRKSGTSFSCPLVSGVCALLLQSHPQWGPLDVNRAIRHTARDLGKAGPDTLYGWGLVDAKAADGFQGDSTLVPEDPGGSVSVGEGLTVYPPFPNPSPDRVNFRYKLASEAMVGLEIYSSVGELVASVSPERFPAASTLQVLSWDGTRGAGTGADSGSSPAPLGGARSTLSSGVYYYRLCFGEQSFSGKIAIVR